MSGFESASSEVMSVQLTPVDGPMPADAVGDFGVPAEKVQAGLEVSEEDLALAPLDSKRAAAREALLDQLSARKSMTRPTRGRLPTSSRYRV